MTFRIDPHAPADSPHHPSNWTKDGPASVPAEEEKQVPESTEPPAEVGEKDGDKGEGKAPQTQSVDDELAVHLDALKAWKRP